MLGQFGIAEKNDQINLKNTYFRTAKLFEVSNDYDKAMEFFEKSGNHRREVPRMLFENNEIERLEAYI